MSSTLPVTIMAEIEHMPEFEDDLCFLQAVSWIDEAGSISRHVIAKNGRSGPLLNPNQVLLWAKRFYAEQSLAGFAGEPTKFINEAAPEKGPTHLTWKRNDQEAKTPAVDLHPDVQVRRVSPET